ncbi:MAG: hypothetical protein J6X66_03455 [Lachnospiraceae bacterium]|nr:hypothetical protein [Lachnospiraceae bacterium]
MKTELIYSKNKSEDIENAITEIENFRSQYSSMLESSDYRFWDYMISGLLLCAGFLSLRLHILPLIYIFMPTGIISLLYSIFSTHGITGPIRARMARNENAALIEKDNELKSLLDELKEIKDYVEISNILQETYARYNGSLDIKVDEKHNTDGTTYFEMNIVTQGYSDDLGKSGSIRIPGINRTFRLTRAALDKTFSRGVIDFSWLDGDLFGCARKAADIHEGMTILGLNNRKRLPMKDEMPKAEFLNSGDNPRDILD